MDPPVSLPSATTAVPCATTAADPPLDPPGTRASATGLRTRPKAAFSVDGPTAHRSEGRVLGGRAHGELVAIGLAQNHPACLFDADERRGIVRRGLVGQQA